MDIVIPINFSYLRQRYRFSDQLSKLLLTTVMPDLTERLTRDRRVTSLDIFASEDLSDYVCRSAKIRMLPSNTEDLVRAEDVILAYNSQRRRDKKSATLIVYNPLFPFVSLEKLEFGYTSVSEGACSSAIGGYSTRLGVQNTAELKLIDHGVFSIVNLDRIQSTQSRLDPPVDIIGLSSLELVSLRSLSDYELFGLIKNSGFS